MHKAPRIAAPEVLRIHREWQDGSSNLLRHSLLEQSLVGCKRSLRVLLDLLPCLLTHGLVNRLERVRTGLPDLRPNVIRHVEIRLDLCVPTAPFVVGVARAMTVMLPDDEQR